jgi:type IV fimbrial biogenesis protein FimT
MAAATRPRGRAGGFTMIELMMVIMVAAILTGLSAPLFTQFTRNQRIKAATSELTYTLTLARGEAIKRNVDVAVEPDGDGWEFGWTVTADGAADPLLVYAAPAYDDGGDRVSYLSITGPDDVTYNGVGRLVGATVAGFEIESASGESTGAKTRCVAIELSGLPRSTVSKTGDCP